jgi:uncharacterized membrane protein
VGGVDARAARRPEAGVPAARGVRVAVTALPRRAYERLRVDRAALVVAIAAVVWFGLLAVDVWRRHDRFETFDYDLGFHAHYVWLLSRGSWFSAINGLPAFGHNATFGYFLFVPFAWLGLPVPHVLNIVQAAVLALGVVPLFRLARRRFETTWVVAAIPVIYLLHPVVQGNVAESFHPEAMAMTPLLAAYDAADERRWRRYWVFAALAIIWKADVALFLAVLGVFVVRRWDRHFGWATFAFGVAWLIVMVGLMIPSQAGGNPVWSRLYGDLGSTPGAMVETTVRHPSRVVSHLRDGDPVGYARDLLAPYGFVPLLAPVALVAAVPQNLLNVLSDADFTRDPLQGPHYQSIPVVALTLAMVEGLAFVGRRRPRLLEPAVAVIGACALATTTAWGALAISNRYASWWPEDGDPLREAKEIAVAAPDAGDVVSAHWRFVPHLADRKTIYSFPNPWRQRFYGVDDTVRPDPANVEWIVLDVDAALDGGGQSVLDCIVDAGTFDETFRDDAIVVYRRITGLEPRDLRCS